MKKVILFFILFMCFMIRNAYLEELNGKLIGKKIIIDIGHGGKDSGTIYGNIKEKDINLSIGLKLRDALIKNGVYVQMLREGDYDLALPNAKKRKKSDFDNRIKVINASGSDMYISLHINYLDNSKYYGAQVFYTKENKKLADTIQKEFINGLKSPMKSRKITDDIYMYKKLRISGVLIECGFISNDNERKLLISDEYQDKIVENIVKGLIIYY